MKWEVQSNSGSWLQVEFNERYTIISWQSARSDATAFINPELARHAAAWAPSGNGWKVLPVSPPAE